MTHASKSTGKTTSNLWKQKGRRFVVIVESPDQFTHKDFMHTPEGQALPHLPLGLPRAWWSFYRQSPSTVLWGEAGCGESRWHQDEAGSSLSRDFFISKNTCVEECTLPSTRGTRKKELVHVIPTEPSLKSHFLHKDTRCLCSQTFCFWFCSSQSK